MPLVLFCCDVVYVVVVYFSCCRQIRVLIFPFFLGTSNLQFLLELVLDGWFGLLFGWPVPVINRLSYLHGLSSFETTWSSWSHKKGCTKSEVESSTSLERSLLGELLCHFSCVPTTCAVERFVLKVRNPKIMARFEIFENDGISILSLVCRISTNSEKKY